jgi:PmbA protein
LLDKVISKAKNLGFSAELFYVKRREFSVRIERQYSSKDLFEEGYGLRVFKEGKMGFAFSTRPSESLVEDAISAWKVSEEDEANQIPLPSKVNYLPLAKEFDLREVTLKYVETLRELYDSVNVITIHSEAYESTVGLINTEGLHVEERRKGISVVVMANSKEGTNVSPEIVEYKSFRDPSTDVGDLIEEVKAKVDATKNREKIKGKVDALILTPKAVAELVFPLLSHAVSRENQFRGKSPLRQGMQVNEGLKVFDDPTLQDSVYSRSFDGEGQGSRINVVIDKEVKGFLSNWFWALKSKSEHTASASRSYLTTPGISPSNLVIEHKDLLESGENYLVVDQVQGVHTSNFDTGEFSVTAPVAWFSKDMKGVRDVIITGNLVDLLRGIEAEGKERKLVDNVLSGELLIRGLHVS